MTDPPLIRVHDLSKVYGRRLWKKGFRALDGVSLEVGRGSVFGLLGPNGAGKTTLIKILLGLVPGWKGEAELFGERAGRVGPRRRVGFLPEGHRLPGYLTGAQALELFGMYSGRSRAWLRTRIPAWLERVGMGASADRKLREYSKGMQQRIGLVQALIHEPELVFLDEPTDGVDPVGRKIVREILAELQSKGTTIFVNSHLLLEVERMCDRVVILARGRILREGTIDELTPATGRVTFDLAAPVAPLEGELSRLCHNLVLGAHGFEAEVDLEGQNRLIDLLRSRGVAIRSISERKLTLEDAFIDLVERRDP